MPPSLTHGGGGLLLLCSAALLLADGFDGVFRVMASGLVQGWVWGDLLASLVAPWRRGQLVIGHRRCAQING